MVWQPEFDTDDTNSPIRDMSVIQTRLTLHFIRNRPIGQKRV